MAETSGEGTNAEDEEDEGGSAGEIGRVVFTTGVFVDRTTGTASLTGEGFVAGADVGGAEWLSGSEGGGAEEDPVEEEGEGKGGSEEEVASAGFSQKLRRMRDLLLDWSSTNSSLTTFTFLLFSSSGNFTPSGFRVPSFEEGIAVGTRTV